VTRVKHRLVLNGAISSLKIKRDNSLVIYRPSEKPHVIEEVSQYDFAALVKQINELNTPLYVSIACYGNIESILTATHTARLFLFQCVP
jgi:hypothetical protein